MDHAKDLDDLMEADRKESFNVFTAIRKSHDEVNLHSRFLYALLRHRDVEGGRPYLKKFLSSIEKTSKFEADAEYAMVEREHRNIDLLITYGTDWAVVIENKIGAGDQAGQLGRYYQHVRQYRQRVVLYLTPDGRKPEAQSAEYTWEGKVRKAPVWCISYRDDILPWLIRCQQEALEEPSLRESIAQYRSVVEQLTNHSIGGPYMEKLTELCLRDLPVIMDLMRASVPAKKRMLRTIWSRIAEVTEGALDGPGFPVGAGDSDDMVDRNGLIDSLLPNDDKLEKRQCPRHGLRWLLGRERDAGGSDLRVEMNGRYGLYYGVYCSSKDANHGGIRNVLSSFGVDPGPPTPAWPWWSTHGVPAAADPKDYWRKSWDQLALLANDETALAECADKIAKTLVEVRNTLHDKMPELFNGP